MLLSESHLWWWNGPTFHHQFTTGPLDMANSTYVGTTLHGSVTGGGGGTNDKLVPAMPWGFFLFFLVGCCCFLNGETYRHGIPPPQHPPQPWATRNVGSQQSSPPRCFFSVCTMCVAVPALEQPQGLGGWREAAGQSLAPWLPEQNLPEESCASLLAEIILPVSWL